MHTLPDPIIDNYQGSERVSPPPAEKSIEDEANQDRTGKIGIDESNMSLRHKHDITELLACHAFPICEQQHNYECSSQPHNAYHRRLRVRLCKQSHSNLRQNVDSKGEECCTDEAQCKSFTV